MLFNSIAFLVFLPTVFALYWSLSRRRKLQNVLLLVASYVFYGWWDWRFLSLIFISSLVDYVVGRRLPHVAGGGARKGWLAVSVCVNLGLLGVFKYFNFFADSLIAAAGNVGLSLSAPSLRIVLPVGISFYTFQTMSYTIDVYRRHIEPTHDPVDFFAFVSFFPQLVAGPIERAANLLPQFEEPRYFSFHEASMGLRQALWGFFKKVVIADRCAMVVDHIFERPDAFSGPLLFVGLFLFAWQIYCDFSGYSDIAIGTARLFGFRLMTNFKTPYFSRDIAEFWRRWHISLSTWFRDYLYIPLGGSRGGRLRRFRNVAIIFTVSGLWHGANWTFVCWGALHALFFLPLLLSGRNRRHLDTVAEGRRFPSFGEALRVVGTFLLTTAAWAFFRSRTLGQAVAYLGRMVCTMGTPTAFGEVPGGRYGLLLTLLFIFFVAAFEWVHRAKRDPSDWGGPRWSRWCFYVILVNLLLFFGVFERMEFIYFQF